MDITSVMRYIEHAMEFSYKRAHLDDLSDILQLHMLAYDGTYPDPTFQSVEKLSKALMGDVKYIYVAQNSEKKAIGCILFNYDKENLLAKAGGAVVAPEFRGHNITQKLLDFGLQDLNEHTGGIEVLYITTRTVHKAAQVLTQNMGFKQLGIFPNVHKTKDYETHALAAMFFRAGLTSRFTDFEQHPKVLPLFNIVRENVELPKMQEAQIWQKKDYYGEVPKLEVISAPEFVRVRMQKLTQTNEIDLGFFPFHTPNVLITSPNQNIEVFAYVNEIDKHCVITGCKIDREVSFADLFLKVSNILRDMGIRYIEVILRANRLNIIDKIISAKFLPCGYVPAFQLEEEKRYDYVVFSRSFEILDFANLQLTGANKKYLGNYIKLWEKTFLGDFFKNEN